MQVQCDTQVGQVTKARLRYPCDLPGRVGAIQARSQAPAKPLEQLPPVADSLGVSCKAGKGRVGEGGGE